MAKSNGLEIIGLAIAAAAQSDNDAIIDLTRMPNESDQVLSEGEVAGVRMVTVIDKTGTKRMLVSGEDNRSRQPSQCSEADAENQGG